MARVLVVHDNDPDRYAPADGNEAQRRLRRHLAIAVQIASPTPTREEIAEALTAAVTAQASTQEVT